MRLSKSFLLICVFLLVAGVSMAGDWPMWRYDAGHTAACDNELPGQLELQWVREFSPRETVWDDPLNQDMMPYDRIFEPVVMDKTMFIGFNDSDKLLAVDTETGHDKWTFYVDGPVRLAPVADATSGKVLCVSDDGYLYCLDAETGQLSWKLRGGPSDRKLLGNKRLISVWPARGGPVVKDGIVYFAASIWPMMGTFIYAVSIESGQIVWQNDSTNALWLMQPHKNPAFAGVAPQGIFTIESDTLLIPGGRSVPAAFDLETGEFRYYRFADYSKTGGTFIAAANGVFFSHHREEVTSLYKVEDGDQVLAQIGGLPVISEGRFYMSGETIRAIDPRRLRVTRKKGEKVKPELWEVKVDSTGDLIKVGSRLYAAGGTKITCLELSRRGAKTLSSIEVSGQVERLLAADAKLFAVTLEGQIMAFGSGTRRPANIANRKRSPKVSKKAASQAKAILSESGVQKGYALLFGAGDGEVLKALALNSGLTIAAFDKDEDRVATLKKELDAAGLYGKGAVVHRGTPTSVDLPPYMASLTVIDDLDGAGFELSKTFLERVFNSMRPYDGKLWLPLTGKSRDDFVRLAKTSSLAGLKVDENKNGVWLTREGPLPGAASWTHQYGNIANTVKSDDVVVKMPLGVLWFGGSSHEDVLPRHAHGPSEQIIGGRLFIEGMDSMSARDVYTGRVLWTTKLGDLGGFGIYYNQTYKDTPTVSSYNQIHMPGANSRGSNFVATMDKVYIIQAGSCHVLDSVSGKVLDTFDLPQENGKEASQWAYIGVYDDLLIAGAEFEEFSHLLSAEDRTSKVAKRRPFYNFDKTASDKVLVMDRHTGKVIWSASSSNGFMHNGIIAARETLYCLDRIPPYVESSLSRRGKPIPGGFRLVAFDVRTGAVKWENQEDVFGTWLGYSDEYDVLLQSTRPSSDMVLGENGKRMSALNGIDGTPIWSKELSYNNPPILHGDNIITGDAMYELLTGKEIERSNPLTGKPMPWRYEKTKGCGYNVASEYLLTFRSSAAAFYDLATDGGTGHLGGFKSSCSPNMIAADGVLNAPDYTRTCQCAFQNQTSLALIHMPDVEVWTTFPELDIDGPIKRLGINLGAAGDRVSDEGTLWLDYPVAGGASPEIEIAMDPEKPDSIRRHTSYMKGDCLKWVGGSAVEGMTKLSVGLVPQTKKKDERTWDSRTYTVRLYFAELEDTAPGERVFSVLVQGQEVLSEFDIVKAAKGTRSTIYREFTGIKATDLLEIELVSSGESKNTLLNGVEIFEETE